MSEPNDPTITIKRNVELSGYVVDGETLANVDGAAIEAALAGHKLSSKELASEYAILVPEKHTLKFGSRADLVDGLTKLQGQARSVTMQHSLAGLRFRNWNLRFVFAASFIKQIVEPIVRQAKPYMRIRRCLIAQGPIDQQVASLPSSVPQKDLNPGLG
jgi:hypothetical protein